MIVLKDFISQNFEIPGDNLDNICSFIENDGNLEKIIFDLPSFIRHQMKYEKLKINFKDELEEDFIHLEVGIFSTLDIQNLLKLENELEEQLYDLYDWDSCDKIILNVEKINN